jgi:UPF0755 protein
MSKAKAAPNRRKPRRWHELRRSRRSQRWALGLVVVLVSGAAWAALEAYEDFTGYPDRAGVGDAGEIEIEIPRGSSFTRVLSLLQEHEVIAAGDAGMFKLFVLNEGAASKVTAGRHTFRSNMSPKEVLAELMKSQPAEEIKVTIAEGLHMLQVADVIAEAGLGDRESLLAAMRKRELLDKWEIKGESAEGYLFPDTYRFARRTSAEDIVERLIRRNQQIYEDLRRKHYDAAEDLVEEFGWEEDEVLTLASIVEKETSVKAERPHISRVFLNRLRFKSFSPKRLETDPTIIYGCTVPVEKSEACKKFEGRIRRIHLRDPDNPYNTYTHEGLPPGPISNPGRAAIEAVFAPRRSKAVFFVARNDGTHHFSATRAEHEAAVDKYIRGGAVGDGVPQ